jgi:hypothetical protein
MIVVGSTLWGRRSTQRDTRRWEWTWAVQRAVRRAATTGWRWAGWRVVPKVLMAAQTAAKTADRWVASRAATRAVPWAASRAG